MGPLIPYIQLGELKLPFLKYLPVIGERFVNDPPSIKPFGALVAFGVYIGAIVAGRHAKQRGLNPEKMGEYVLWVVLAGFLGGHMLDAIFYHPGRLAKEPLYLFMIWDGLSSFGGFTGAIIGAASWRFYRKERILGYSECINSAFPLAWVFGRMGCSVVHDHLGKYSDAWLAVRYPIGEQYIGRLDLGLIECVLTIPLAVAFLILWRRKTFRPLGFYTGVMCVAYAPVRFVLDFFRMDESGDAIHGDPHYGGLTPAQWAAVGLLFAGFYYLRIASKGYLSTNEMAVAEGAPVEPSDTESSDASDGESSDEVDADAKAKASASGDDASASDASAQPKKRRAKKKRKPADAEAAASEEPQEGEPDKSGEEGGEPKEA